MRISALNGAIGVIDYHEDTDAAARDLELQIEDGVLAAQSCLREGYVDGGRLVWGNLGSEFSEYSLVFESIANLLPEQGKSWDSVAVIVQAIRSAASLAGQLKDAEYAITV